MLLLYLAYKEVMKCPHQLRHTKRSNKKVLMGLLQMGMLKLTGKDTEWELQIVQF